MRRWHVPSFSVLAFLPLLSPPLTLVREEAVVVAPPFAGFTTQVSADGTTAMTAGYDGSLLLWKIAPNGAVSFLDALRVKRSPAKPNDGIAFALGPNGRQIAVSAWDGRVEVWDRVSVKRVHALESNPPTFDRIAFHPTRPWLLVGSFKGTRRLDLATGKTIPLAVDWPIDAVPNTDLLASPAGLTDGKTGRLVRRWHDRTYSVDPLRVSPDGKLLVMGGEDPNWRPPEEAATEAAYARTQTLRTWRIADGKLLRTMPGFWTMGSSDQSLIWLDNRRVAVPGLGDVRDAVTGRTVRKTKPSKEIYEGGLTEIPVVLRGARADRRVTLRFPDPGTRVSSVGFGPGKMMAIHDLRTVFRNPGVTMGARQAATLVAEEGRKTKPNVRVTGSPRGFDERGAFTMETWATGGPKGFAVVELISHPFVGPGLQMRRTLLTPGKPAQMETFDLPQRQGLTRLLPDDYRAQMQSYTAVHGNGMWILNSNFGDHDTIFAVSERDGREVWRVKEKDWHPQLTSLAANAYWVTFEWERYDTRKTELVLLRAATGEIVHRVPSSMVIASSFSPDGKMLGIVSNDAVAVVDLTARKPALRPMREGVNPLDGNLSDPSLYWTGAGRLVVASSLRPVQVYDPSTGRLLATARFYGDGSWSAVRADGVIDGPGKADVRVYRKAAWVRSMRREPFFLDLLK